MSTADISRKLRAVLEQPPKAEAEVDLYALVDDFILTCSSAEDSAALLYALEDELQTIHADIVDHDSCEHTSVLLTVLRHLSPILSATSIISTWWDLVLRPALRDPKLPRTVLAYAKDLTLTALEQPDDSNPEKQKDFQRRILDLYLLDAFNDGSGEDMLEWAELPADERERRATWKANLEDVLVKFGLDQPEAFFWQTCDCFADPSSRLQILGLLTRYTVEPEFERHVPVLASHPLIDSILTSLLVDNSTTVCVFSLNLLTKLLPMFAASVVDDIRRMLPRLFAIFARMLCWKERKVTVKSSDEAVTDDEDAIEGSPASVNAALRSLDLRPELNWQRLDHSFGAVAAPPSAKRFFTSIYYLFPCNTIAFLRQPSGYLTERGAECPYVGDWDEMLDNDQIKSKSELILMQHVVHAQIIWRDAQTELNQPPFFEGYDVPRITSEALMLAAFRHGHTLGESAATSVTEKNTRSEAAAAATDITMAAGEIADDDHPIAETSGEPHRLQLSLQKMLTTSVALKSDLDVDVVDAYPHYPFHLFDPSNSSLNDEDTQSMAEQSPAGREEGVPLHIALVISALQREILLLRNELSFELWLSRENVKQMAFLYEHRILTRNAEAERQGLHNKLREYKARTVRLEKQLKDQKDQGALTKSKYADWNTELQHKLHDLREQKRTWKQETAALQLAEQDVRTNFAAQGKLLAEAERRVFQLETMRKETQHKVDRLRDYERQIEQLTATQKLWDADVQRNKELKEVMKAMSSKYQKMVLRVESYEHQMATMEEQARAANRQIQAGEKKLAFKEMQARNVRRDSEPRKRAEAQAEASRLASENARLRESNNDLQEEMDELKAMVEVLRAQVSGRTGLANDPSRSPILIGSPRLA